MTCCQCQGIEEAFNRKYVRRNLRKYRRKGAARTTRILLEAIEKEGIGAATVLDIGGGIGAIPHALLKAGAASVISVEASASYIEAARQEAQRLGLSEQIDFRHGNFVDMASEIPPADIVTLDRVICCYDDMAALVEHSSAHARRLYGVVYPRDTGRVKFVFWFLNLFLSLFRKQFRTFIHPTRQVEAILSARGLQRKKFYATAGIWQIALFAR